MNNKVSNLLLAYEDTRNSIKTLQANLQSINNRLTLLLGFSQVFILIFAWMSERIHFNLNCYFCLAITGIISVLAGLSVGICLHDLIPQPTPLLIKPEALIRQSDKECNFFITMLIGTNSSVIADLKKQYDEKYMGLAIASICFGVAIVLSLVDAMYAILHR